MRGLKTSAQISQLWVIHMISSDSLFYHDTSQLFQVPVVVYHFFLINDNWYVYLIDLKILVSTSSNKIKIKIKKWQSDTTRAFAQFVTSNDRPSIFLVSSQCNTDYDTLAKQTLTSQ